MKHFRWMTAGESHGPELTAVVDGIPAGLPLLVEHVNDHLARHQQGYGRGGRMKIETDRVRLVGGVRRTGRASALAGPRQPARRLEHLRACVLVCICACMRVRGHAHVHVCVSACVNLTSCACKM